LVKTWFVVFITDLQRGSIIQDKAQNYSISYYNQYGFDGFNTRGIDGSTSGFIYPKATIAVATPYILSLGSDLGWTASGSRLYTNGALQSIQTLDGFGTNRTGAIIGGFMPYLNYKFDGQIAEIITYDYELDDTQRGHVEAYLANKYNITI
jgi:hypothetical protein